MKIESLKLKLSYFFKQRIRGRDSSSNMLELVKPESEWKRTERLIEDILRWAHDGGRMWDIKDLIAWSNSDKASEQENE